MDEPTPNHPESTTRGVYAHAAPVYWAGGWRGILPLPIGQKKSPPTGWTGRDGRTPSYPDVQSWMDSSPSSNIALRMPPHVIGIDVDAHGHKKGAESFATLLVDLGPLPPTWISTARQDGTSGIRFYRVPAGTRWRERFAGPGIDLIHAGHRYAAVWPSTNPDAGGAPYVWIGPTGERGIGAPRIEDLPELPARWLEGLSESGEVAAPAAAVTASSTSTDPFAAPTRSWSMDEVRAELGPKLTAYRDLRTPEDSGFNQKLNDLAMFAGHFVPEFMSLEHATERLFEASEHNGSVAHQGAHAVHATIASGLGAGMRQPFRRRESDTEGSLDPSAPPPVAESDAVDRLMAEMLDVDAVLALPPPTPLIRDVLDLDSESWIISKAGGFKSFVALDMAAHVALGLPWRGRPVQQGKVVYVVAEGRKSIGQRLKAWIQTYGQRPDGLHVLPRPVQVRDAAGWATLVAACTRIEPVLIILDTQARITVGLAENDNGEMGVLTEAVRRLKEATGACVLVVHHQGRTGEDGRGASAIDGAQDTELKVVRPEGVARSDLTGTLVMDKQKDAAEDLEFEFQMRVVDLGIADDGRQLTSLALVPLDTDPFGTVARRPAPDWEERISENQGDIVAALRAHSDDSGALKAEILTWIKERRALDGRQAMPKTSFGSAVRDLKRKILITQIGQRYYLTEFIKDDES